MPISDFDRTHVIPMYKAGGNPVVKYAHDKKEWTQFNEQEGYSDDPRSLPKQEWPKCMRKLGSPSTKANNPEHEAQLRAQGWTTDPLPKGHNDPVAQIHPVKANADRMDYLEAQNRDLIAKMADLTKTMAEMLEMNTAPKGKKGAA